MNWVGVGGMTGAASPGNGFAFDFNSSGISLGAQSQLVWPRMSQTDVQRYTKVFVEVDNDRDGKITGEEARNLFLSWLLPREVQVEPFFMQIICSWQLLITGNDDIVYICNLSEVLKQVWDLSDQDNDGMLSLREFCIALHLMERYI
jgi:epidermal growth factor receptor substrate 15